MKNFKFFLFAALFSILLTPFALAADSAPNLESFRTMYSVDIPEMELATEVIVEMPENYELGYAVIENESGEAQATNFYKDYETLSFHVTENSSSHGNVDDLVDGKYLNTVEFDIDTDDGEAYVILDAGKDVTLSRFNLSLGNSVATPNYFALYAFENGQWSTVVANKYMSSLSNSFPETTAQQWKLELQHSQPLYVRELSFYESKVTSSGAYLIWLARPGESYALYTDAATYTKVSTEEGGNLSRDAALEATLDAAEENALFIEPDVDEDGVIDLEDNCVSVSNTDQTDLDKNDLGDACEDHDGDSVIDSEDNCPEHANRLQKDADGDGIGDECDDAESRLTENLPWLPWAAMGAAGLIVMLVVVASLRKR